MHKRLNPSPIEKVFVIVTHQDGSRENYTLDGKTQLSEIDIKEKKRGTVRIKLEGTPAYSVDEPRKLPTKAEDLHELHVGYWLDAPNIHGKITSANPIETSDGRDNWSVIYVDVQLDGGRWNHRLEAGTPIKVSYL